MLKKIFIVFAFVLVTQIIAGCVDCNCGPIQTFYTTTKSLFVNNIDSTLPEPMITNSSIINAKNYGFKINLRSDRVALKNQKVNWGFIQAAYACSCAENVYKSKESILTLEIFSNNDFDANHPKNTDLSSYFKVKISQNLNTMPEYVKYINRLYQTSSNPFYWGIFLQTSPSLSKKHQFKIRMTLSDGRILEAETTEVELI
ncbi:MAG: DUF5034 domain-containing protein [Pedobacter sp.]|nr:MAG: DUF5034 domain-containing protein [Pedobacter sp.]